MDDFNGACADTLDRLHELASESELAGLVTIGIKRDGSPIMAEYFESAEAAMMLLAALAMEQHNISRELDRALFDDEDAPSFERALSELASEGSA